ncbi:MAG: HAD-IIA family hydrolase [Candidatus Heimdallarchaeota archaeon]|nr:HAD-IIA family hydrolase [Candidatus Heimdallarchaeota archaeon]
MEKLLDGIKCFIFDVDGTLILGNSSLPFATEVLKILKEKRIDFIILSNNSSYSILENKSRLEKVLNIELSYDNIFTSTQATVEFLTQLNITQIYNVGTPSMVKDFEDNGISQNDKNPQAVVLGFDKTLTYKKIQKVSQFLLQAERIPFYATHPDDTCPIDGGKIPDVGSFLKMFEQATGRKADKILGKPSKMILEFSLQSRNVKLSEVLVIGDRLDTDIQMAHDVGVKSSLVLTGETSRSALKLTKIHPTFIWTDLEILYDFLRNTEELP